MTKITYGTKTAVEPQVSHATQWWADDANEVKTTINENDTVDTSTSTTVLFDQVSGYRHGTWTTPLTGDITLDETGAEEGGCAVVIWQGSSNPTFLSGQVQNTSGIITIEGVYSVYIHYINGRFNINIFNVANPSELEYLFWDYFTGSTISTTKWTDNQTINCPITQNDELILTPSGSVGETNYVSSLVGLSAITMPTTFYMTFDLTHADQNNSTNWEVGVNLDADSTVTTDRIVVANTGTAGKIVWLADKFDQTIKTDTDTIDISTVKTFKMAIEATTMKMYYWNSGWTQLGISTTISATIPPRDYYPIIANTDAVGITDALTVDNFIITATDFTTQRP